jgi:hypothetical protein
VKRTPFTVGWVAGIIPIVTVNSLTSGTVIRFNFIRCREFRTRQIGCGRSGIVGEGRRQLG